MDKKKRPIQNRTTNKTKEVSIISKTTKKQWKESWEIDFPWLVYNEASNTVGCKYCISAQKPGLWGSCGYTDFGTNQFKCHSRSSKHISARPADALDEYSEKRGFAMDNIEEVCLLHIDLQKYCGGHNEDFDFSMENRVAKLGDKLYFYRRIKEVVIPNVKKLQDAFRKLPCEVMFTVIEALTKDGRDQSLDYKLSKIFVPAHSKGAKMLTGIEPHPDEIVIPKTSCSVFNSTNIDYVLRNIGLKYLVLVGIVTNQCVESTVRDAADKGYYVTVVSDACAAYTEEDHEQALRNMAGFARIITTDSLLETLMSTEMEETEPEE